MILMLITIGLIIIGLTIHKSCEFQDDCVKEESDTVKQINDFGKVANSISMKIVFQ